jgi:hypothetical protein
MNSKKQGPPDLYIEVVRGAGCCSCQGSGLRSDESPEQRAALTVAAAGHIRFALSQWCALARYVDDGLLEIGRVELWRGSIGLA